MKPIRLESVPTITVTLHEQIVEKLQTEIDALKNKVTLIDFIKEVEENHFRTNLDTGANWGAMFILNCARIKAKLHNISEGDLPKWDAEKNEYVMPVDSFLYRNLDQTNKTK